MLEQLLIQEHRDSQERWEHKESKDLPSGQVRRDSQDLRDLKDPQPIQELREFKE